MAGGAAWICPQGSFLAAFSDCWGCTYRHVAGAGLLRLYGPHWSPVAIAVAMGLVAIVTFGSLAGSMLPFALQRLGFDQRAPLRRFVATLIV